MEKRIDARGMICPRPVILAKKEMDKSQEGDQIYIEVDNEMASENLRKLANSQKAGFVSRKLGEKHYEIRITAGVREKETGGEEIQEREQETKKKEKTVVVFSSDKMGEGEEELGRILIKGFVYALTQMEKLPDTLLFYNRGAFLTSEGSPVLEDLKLLEQEGCRIFTCGTCMDYYGLKEKLQVGEGANMYLITETQMKADKIIKP